MPKVTKKCRCCGKEYKVCPDIKTAPGVFKWQDVACTPECGEEYLRRINESRGVAPAVQKKPRRSAKKAPVAEKE